MRGFYFDPFNNIIEERGGRGVYAASADRLFVLDCFFSQVDIDYVQSAY